MLLHWSHAGLLRRLMTQEDFPYDATSNLLTHLGADETPASQPKMSWKDRLLRMGEAPPIGSWRGVPASLAIIGLITMTGFQIETIIRGSNFAVLYMLAVIFSALRWGWRAAVLSAVSGALSFTFFFVPPYRSFAVTDIWYLITLIGLLTVGLVISVLTVAAREDARLALRREASTAALYSFTASLTSGNSLSQILDAVARHFAEVFQRPIVVLLPDADRLTVRFRSAELVFSDRENEIVSWVFQKGQEAGCGTEVFPGSRIRYRPLKTGQGIVGVIGFQTKSSKDLLPPDQIELLGIFMNQTALAITRADLAQKAQRAEVLQEADKLQKALLNSVSHNLRTPLASVLGVLNTILEDGVHLDLPTQRSLLKTAQEEAKRLDWLVQNLLDMTRLEGGAIRVKTELCDVHDVIGAALHQLGEAAHSHSISVAIAPNLPLVPMDDVLIVQVLVNILDNALKYSPGAAPIEIEARLQTAQLEIRVLDRGRGIPEQDLERVFDKFFRVALPGAPKGAGLGLSICKGLVEAHNGRILAKRRTLGGTEFAFFLPMEAKRE
jgi:two-component system sensor histidine kinase KdpD